MKDSVIRSNVRAFGKDIRDSIRIRDSIFLEGENARSVIKLKAAAKDGGEVLMYGITEGNAPHCNGHVECSEIVLGQGSICRARPFIRATDPTSSISHEASLGRFPQKWLDELGLSKNKLEMILAEGLAAKETRFFAYKGEVTDQREVIDWDIRHRFLRLAMEYKELLAKSDPGPQPPIVFVNQMAIVTPLGETWPPEIAEKQQEVIDIEKTD